MTWRRMVARNGLRGDYDDDPPFRNGLMNDPAAIVRASVAGDLRRIERNSRDPRHLAAYSRLTGLSEMDVLAVLDAFFAYDGRDLDFTTWPADAFGDCEMEATQ